MIRETIVRLDIVDNQPEGDADRVLETYYLVNPDMRKLNELRKAVESRFEDYDDNPAFGSIADIDAFVNKHFITIAIGTEEIEW